MSVMVAAGVFGINQILLFPLISSGIVKAMGKSKSGFTIVELLIVIVVIAILAAITVVAFNGVQARALESEKASRLNNVQKALTNFYTLNGYYPTSNTITGSPGAQLIGLTLKDVEPSRPTNPGAGIEGGYIGTDTTHIRYMAWPYSDGAGGGNDCGAENKCQSFVMGYYDQVKAQQVIVRNPGHRGY